MIHNNACSRNLPYSVDFECEVVTNRVTATTVAMYGFGKTWPTVEHGICAFLSLHTAHILTLTRNSWIEVLTMVEAGLEHEPLLGRILVLIT